MQKKNFYKNSQYDKLDIKKIIAVIKFNTTYAVVKRKPEKKSGLYGIPILPTELTSHLGVGHLVGSK